jgi:hypothetical protein
MLVPNTTPAPEINREVDPDDGSVTITVTAHTFRIIQLVQCLTDNDGPVPENAIPYYGQLAGLSWRDPNLFGRRRTFTAEATATDHTVYKLVVVGLSLGYPGGGPADTVEVLVQLGIAERDLLRTCILKPAPGWNARDAWKAHLQPADFGHPAE